jgi:tetratricopeptide (TPR) repeat protein
VQRLEEAKGDTRAQSALTAEFLLMTKPAGEREPLRAALDAAAVLRWFDVSLVSRVLAISDADAEIRFASLRTLSFVEPYEGNNKVACTLEQNCRLGWRQQLFQRDQNQFHILSIRAAEYFGDYDTDTGRIECIYHLLCGHPERGAEKLEDDWSNPEVGYYFAMAAPLQEIVDNRLARGRAHAWILLALARARIAAKDTEKAEKLSKLALSVARSEDDQRAAGYAHCLLGDILLVQGKLSEAQSAFDTSLTAFQNPTVSTADNPRVLWDQSQLYGRIGRVLQAQGHLVDALEKLTHALDISRGLVESEPTNGSWRRELASALGAVGEVLEAQGNLAEAQSMFEQYLSITRRLAAEYPGNIGYRHDLVIAESRVGDVLRAREKLTAALLAFAAALENTLQIIEQDHNNITWQRQLANIHLQLFKVLNDLGLNEDAREQQSRALQIRQIVALREPGNARYHRDVLSALSSFFSSDERYKEFSVKDLADSEMRTIYRTLDQLRPADKEPVYSTSNLKPHPATLFICYSSKDAEWRADLKPSLDILVRKGVINFWYDRMVDAGRDWDDEIQQKLDECEIIVCLVSRDFLAAPYIQEKELPKALDRHRGGKARLIPLIVRSCSWADTPLDALQTATGDRRPLKDREDRDDAYLRVEKELENTWRVLRGLPKKEVQTS